MKIDPSSQSNAEQLRITAANIDLEVDFVRQVLSGHVDYTAVAESSNVTELVLDTRALAVSRTTDAVSGADLKVSCKNSKLHLLISV